MNTLKLALLIHLIGKQVVNFLFKFMPTWQKQVGIDHCSANHIVSENTQHDKNTAASLCHIYQNKMKHIYFRKYIFLMEYEVSSLNNYSDASYGHLHYVYITLIFYQLEYTNFISCFTNVWRIKKLLLFTIEYFKTTQF